MARVSIEDLAFTMDWLDCYEPDTEELQDRAQRMKAWLRGQIARREGDALIREAARRIGRKPSEVKAAMRRRGARAVEDAEICGEQGG